MINLKLQVGKLSNRGKEFFAGEAEAASVMRDQFAELTKIIKSIGDQLDGEITAEIMREALIPTFEKSQIYCPVKTGDLRDSGYLEIVQFRGSPRVEMGYGAGGKPPYAILVHEASEMYHKPPTRSHWLLAAMLEDTDLMEQRLKASYKALFDGAG